MHIYAHICMLTYVRTYVHAKKGDNYPLLKVSQEQKEKEKGTTEGRKKKGERRKERLDNKVPMVSDDYPYRINGYTPSFFIRPFLRLRSSTKWYSRNPLSLNTSKQASKQQADKQAEAEAEASK